MEMGMNALIRSLLWLEAKDCDGNWHDIADNMTFVAAFGPVKETAHVTACHSPPLLSFYHF